MDNKVTIASLAAMMALATGKQKKLCEDFLQEFFSLISEELCNGESVRIKGFGTFKIVDVEARKSVDVSTGEPNEIPPHRKIIFVAGKELAAIVNSPFEAFEAEEISDNLTTDELTGFSEYSDLTEYSTTKEQEEEEFISQDHPVESISQEPTEETVFQEQDDKIAPQEPSDAVDASEIESADTESLDEEMLEAEAISQASEAEEEPEEYEEDEEDGRSNGRFGWGFLTGFLSAVGIVAVACLIYWYFWLLPEVQKIDGEPDMEISEIIPGTPETKSVITDSISGSVSDDVNGDEVVPTRPSDTPALDTISTTRFLTTMAQDHYGNFNLWPIIYDENSKILGHPDRIKPGTQVVIPSLSKYRINPNNPEDINKMKQRGKAIYDKYR